MASNRIEFTNRITGGWLAASNRVFLDRKHRRVGGRGRVEQADGRGGLPITLLVGRINGRQHAILRGEQWPDFAIDVAANDVQHRPTAGRAQCHIRRLLSLRIAGRA